jgi:hypothetical protein
MWKQLSCCLLLWEFECASGCRAAFFCGCLNVEAAVVMPSIVEV